jgi:hypothetical protein
VAVIARPPHPPLNAEAHASASTVSTWPRSHVASHCITPHVNEFARAQRGNLSQPFETRFDVLSMGRHEGRARRPG